MVHWLIVRTSRPEGVDARLTPLLDGDCSSSGLEAVERTLWWSQDRGTAAAIWTDDRQARWVLDEDGSLLAMTGHAVAPGRAAGPGVRPILRAEGAAACRDLDGMFTAISLRADGRGWIRSDRFGLSPVYRADVGDHVVLANRPADVAAVVRACTGLEPRRDSATIRHVAVLGTAFGDRSGFAGIRRVANRHDVDFGTGGGTREVEVWSRPWEPDRWAASDDPKALLDGVQQRLVDGLRTIVEASTAPVEAELTAGTDSRLVLALARLAGVESQLHFHTFGSPEADDARVAQRISRDIGLAWEMRRARTSEASVDAFVDRVRSTSGEFGAGGLVPPREGTLLLSGIMGEALSAKYVNFIPRFTLHAIRRQRRVLSQVQPYPTAKAVRRTMREVAAEMGRIARDGCPPDALMDVFYLRQRERRWVGARPDRWDRNLFPLYSPDAIVANLQLPAARRQDALIHRTIIERADLPWDISSAGLPPAPPPDDGVDRPVMKPVMQELLALCRDSPGLEFVNLVALSGAVERYSELPRVPRQKVTDALTALVWANPTLCAATVDR
ncbi:MAG: hypothetical protein DHS20C19_00790 [Acidimicrobiales bacterium]|nr:MAG: hypothetical protein DHS20C19_00790 [Acidimicrobiales bacterium]